MYFNLYYTQIGVSSQRRQHVATTVRLYLRPSLPLILNKADVLHNRFLQCLPLQKNKKLICECNWIFLNFRQQISV